MSRRARVPQPPKANASFGRLCMYGVGAGIMGVAVMTVGEKVEQYFTRRPNSLVPGYTLQRLLKLSPRPPEDMCSLNMTMHYGQGAAVAVIRAMMSACGIRGPFADFMFVGVRILVDQTLENWTGVGAPPWTWPVNEQIIDIMHKVVFAVATGYVTDRWL